MPSSQELLKAELRRLRQAVIVPIILLLVVFLVQWSKTWSGIPESHYVNLGILPRAQSGIVGIFMAPFIHDDWQHLLGNAGPLFVLCLIAFFFYPRIAAQNLAAMWLITGFSVWAFAFQDEARHIGASGLVFALAAFTAASGWFRNNRRAVALALIVAISYGSLLGQLFTPVEGVSWESHTFGALSGVLCAWLSRGLYDGIEDHTPIPILHPSERQYFLPREAFEQTKAERELAALHERLQQMEEQQQFYHSTFTGLPPRFF